MGAIPYMFNLYIIEHVAFLKFIDGGTTQRNIAAWNDDHIDLAVDCKPIQVLCLEKHIV